MREEEREDGAALLDVDESSRAAEEVLGAEPVPLRAVSRLAAWESRNLWRLSWASILVQLFNFMLSLVTQMFVGHLGKLDLAGASITNVGIQGLAYGIMLGMASAVQTVCGQAYGAKKYRALGIICQRALILHFAAAIILAFLYWYSGSLLRAIGQSESIAAVGQLYARGLLPQLVAFALYCPMQRFLQAQNIVNPMAYIAVAVLLFHVLISWLAVFVFRFGILGAALTLSFSWWVLVLITWLFIIFNPACKDTWTGFSSQAFKGLWSYLKLTVASAIMLVLEIWYVQGFVLLTGYLKNPEVSLDAVSICVNYWNWDFMIMLGLSNAASVRVGNELGAAHPRVARLAVIVVVATSLGISVVISVLVLLLRTPLSKLYTSSTDVIQMVVQLTPLLAISIFLNGVQPILSGMTRCCSPHPSCQTHRKITLMNAARTISHRSCYREWVARHRCIRERRGLLLHRPPHRMRSRVQNKLRSSWNMVGADNWSLCADTGTRSLDSQDKLEQGGRQGCGTLEA